MMRAALAEDGQRKGELAIGKIVRAQCALKGEKLPDLVAEFPKRPRSSLFTGVHGTFPPL